MTQYAKAYGMFLLFTVATIWVTRPLVNGVAVKVIGKPVL